MRVQLVALTLAAGLAPAFAVSEPADPAPPPERAAMACTREYRPVCAIPPGGTKRTYPNACTARADGARMLLPRPCKT